MLIRSEQLTLNEASDILDESVYLEEYESLLNPVSVPVLENTRLGICTVNYNDIYRICEDYGCFSDEALEAVAESSGIDPDYIAVAIDEADIILDPSIVDEFDAYVINPISENCTEYLLTESALELFLEGDEYGYLDESYLDILVDGIDESYDYLNEVGDKLDKSYYKKGKLNKKGLEELKKRHDALRQKVYEKRLSRFMANNKSLKDYEKEIEDYKNTDEYKNLSPEDQRKKITAMRAAAMNDVKNRRITIRAKTGQKNDDGKDQYKSRATTRAERDALALTRLGKDSSGKDRMIDIGTIRSTGYSRDTNGNIIYKDGKPVENTSKGTAKMTINQILAAKKSGAVFKGNKDGSYYMDTSSINSDDKHIANQFDKTPLNTPSSSVNPSVAPRAKFKALPRGAKGKPAMPPKVQEEIKKAENTNDPGRISKIVASLRNFYRGFLQRAEQEHDSGKIAWYKNIARVILSYIDKLLAKLDKTKQA